MPELPEVEVTRRALSPYLAGRKITATAWHVAELRHPFPPGQELEKQQIRRVERHGKALLLGCEGGTLVVHLGMTGVLRLLSEPSPPMRSDRADLFLDNGSVLRLTDSRMFGSLVWYPGCQVKTSLLDRLGPDALSHDVSGPWLFSVLGSRRALIKHLLMDQHLIAGVGNIYACEALYRARIHPGRKAGSLSGIEFDRLASALKEVLARAIRLGLKTVDAFLTQTESPWHYFNGEWSVYGRTGEDCHDCGEKIVQVRQAGRSTWYCPGCQR